MKTWDSSYKIRTTLSCPKEYQHVHLTATTWLRISVWRKHTRIAFASSCSRKGCHSKGESQNPLAGTLGTILHVLLSSLSPLVGCSPPPVFSWCHDWYESPLPPGPQSCEQPKRHVADHVFGQKAGFYVCLLVIASVYVYVNYRFSETLESHLWYHLMSFFPLMTFHFLGNVASVKREALALIFPHERHPESSKDNKS